MAVIQGFIDHSAASARLGISRQRLDFLQRHGRIATVYLAGRRLYRELEVERLRLELNPKLDVRV